MSFLVGHVEISLESNGAEQSINRHFKWERKESDIEHRPNIALIIT